jgi:L-aspartate oxidase
MAGVHPQEDLAPRDVVARALDAELRAGETVYLSVQHLDPGRVAVRFPNLVEGLAAVGLTLPGGRIPVAPAAHYLMGGVHTDLDARTTVPGLYACGEVACTGVHGANRLASNSLLECFVFAHRAADHAAFHPVSAPAAAAVAALDGDGPAPVELRRRMWRDCGLERDAAGLVGLIGWLDEQAEAPAVTVARLVATAALRREESRGGHVRLDFPAREPRLAHRIVLAPETVA